MAQNLNLLTFLGQKFKDLVHELSHQAVSKYFWKDLLIVLMGVLLYTVGFSFLIYPQRVTTGGLMGICNIITIITGIKVDIPYNIINISLLVIASSSWIRTSLSRPSSGLVSLLCSCP